MDGDVELLIERFKSKIREAIDVLPQIPEEQRRQLWVYWQIVSPAVKCATGGRGTILQKTELEPDVVRRGKRIRRRQKQPFLLLKQTAEDREKGFSHNKYAKIQQALDKQDADHSLAGSQNHLNNDNVASSNTGKVLKVTNTSTEINQIPDSNQSVSVKVLTSYKPTIEATTVHQLSVHGEKLNAFVHISDRDRAAAEAACGKPAVSRFIAAHDTSAASKSDITRSDVDSGKTIAENTVNNNACGILSHTPKRARGRPRKVTFMLVNSHANENSSSSGSIVRAVNPVSRVTSPASALKKSDTSESSNVTENTPAGSASFATSTSEVRRSGRRSVPKKDDFFYYFNLKEPSSKTTGAEIEIDLAEPFDTEEEDPGDEATADKVGIVEFSPDDKTLKTGEAVLKTYSRLQKTACSVAEKIDKKTQNSMTGQQNRRGSQKEGGLQISNLNMQKNAVSSPPRRDIKSQKPARAVDESTDKKAPTIEKIEGVEDYPAEADKSEIKEALTCHKQTAVVAVSLQTPVDTVVVKSPLISALKNSTNSWKLKFPLTQLEEKKLKKRTCTECGIVLLSQASMAAHMRIHTGEKPWSCSVCPKAFATKANCERHQLTHAGIKAFSCPDCGNKFSEKKSLHVHMRTHTGERPYVCDVCHQCFTQPGTLKSHMDRHLQLKRHLCSLCGMKFRQSANLRMHILRHHQSIKKFKCGHCEKLFFTKSDLQRHELKHSGLRPFSCDQCQQTFTRKQSLREHQNTHLGIKPYKCCVCGICFYDFASCHRHVNRHNKGDITVAQAKGNMTDDSEIKEVGDFLTKIEAPHVSTDSNTLDNKREPVAVDSTPIAEVDFPDTGISTVSGNVIVTVDGGREIHLQIPEGITTEQLVAHVQNMLRDQDMDLSGNQTIFITDDSAAPTTLLAGNSAAEADPTFLEFATESGSDTALQTSATDAVLESAPSFLGNVLQLGDGGAYQVTLLDSLQGDVGVIMEEGSFVPEDSVIIPQV